MNRPLKESVNEQEMPRERLERYGPSALSTSELLALLIRTGSRGENVMQLSDRLLKEFGGLRGLGRSRLDELKKVRGLGTAKAVTISATLELASRLLRERLSETPLNEPEKVYEYLAPQMLRLTRESLVVICCDTRLRAQQTFEVSLGNSTQTIAHPPDILKRVLQADSENFIIAHNHPSGDASPSRADLNFTRRLKQASDLLDLRFIDHVIIGSPGSTQLPYYSFAENGQL